MVGSGQKRTVVPVRPARRLADDLELGLELPAVLEVDVVALAVAVDLASTRRDSALTTETPTPWRPPETL